MKIYKSEIEAGLEDQIKANASIAYSSPVSFYIPNTEEKESIKNLVVAQDKAISENKDQYDLYYLSSILVSTGWNKNDDVFDLNETWGAKETPVDKQFNFMHDETDIIGHITGSVVLDSSGNEIDDINCCIEKEKCSEMNCGINYENNSLRDNIFFFHNLQYDIKTIFHHR